MTETCGAGRGELRLILMLLLVAIFSRAAVLGNPIVHVDEEFYFNAARAWLNGAAPYVGVWDRKPLGLFVLYLPAAALGYPAGIWAYQVLALASATATALVAVRLARAGGWAAAAPLAGIAYLLWLDLLEGQGGQAPVFYNLPMALAALLVTGDRAAVRRNGVAALALAGVALTIKPTTVFEAAFFAGWTMVRFWRSGRGFLPTFGYGAMMATAAALPTAICASGYAMIGQLDAWIFANVISIFLRGAEPLLGALGNLAVLVLIVSGPLALATVAWTKHRARATPDQQFLFGWLATACGGVLLFGTWFDHYGLPLLVPASVCAAGAIVRPKVRKVVIVVLILVAVAGQVVLVSKRAIRGTSVQFAAVLRAVGAAPSGCLYVYAGTPMLYAATQRCRVTRWIFPRHLTRTRERRAIGTDQLAEVRRILATRPAVIVMTGPFRGDRADVQASITAAIRRTYARTAAIQLGHERVEIFGSTQR